MYDVEQPYSKYVQLKQLNVPISRLISKAPPFSLPDPYFSRHRPMCPQDNFLDAPGLMAVKLIYC